MVKKTICDLLLFLPKDRPRLMTVKIHKDLMLTGLPGATNSAKQNGKSVIHFVNITAIVYLGDIL